VQIQITRAGLRNAAIAHKARAKVLLGRKSQGREFSDWNGREEEWAVAPLKATAPFFMAGFAAGIVGGSPLDLYPFERFDLPAVPQSLTRCTSPVPVFIP
jgi:hypothetical protein